jgi:hypothetical protein
MRQKSNSMSSKILDQAGLSRECLLEHDPEKWAPVFRKDHAQIKEIERDEDSKKSHHALDGATARAPASADIEAGRSEMSDPTLPSFRYRLGEQAPRTNSGGLVRCASVRQFQPAKASPAPLCACHLVLCASSIGTRMLPNWATPQTVAEALPAEMLFIARPPRRAEASEERPGLQPRR